MLDYVKNINSIENKNKNLYRIKEFKKIIKRTYKIIFIY